MDGNLFSWASGEPNNNDHVGGDSESAHNCVYVGSTLKMDDTKCCTDVSDGLCELDAGNKLGVCEIPLPGE